MMNHDLIQQAEAITEDLWPAVSEALGGKLPEVQGAVLADITAIWLAGHIVAGDPARTSELRERLLGFHLDAIRELVDFYVKARER